MFGLSHPFEIIIGENQNEIKFICATFEQHTLHAFTCSEETTLAGLPY